MSRRAANAPRRSASLRRRWQPMALLGSIGIVLNAAVMFLGWIIWDNRF
jgi:hypothetical protein